jgi:hypothetical protein
MCIVQSHEIKWFFCNQKLNCWWIETQVVTSLVSYGLQVFFAMGMLKVKKGLGEHVRLVLS